MQKPPPRSEPRPQCQEPIHQRTTRSLRRERFNVKRKTPVVFRRFISRRSHAEPISDCEMWIPARRDFFYNIFEGRMLFEIIAECLFQSFGMIHPEFVSSPYLASFFLGHNSASLAYWVEKSIRFSKDSAPGFSFGPGICFERLRRRFQAATKEKPLFRGAWLRDRSALRNCRSHPLAGKKEKRIAQKRARRCIHLHERDSIRYCDSVNSKDVLLAWAANNLPMRRPLARWSPCVNPALDMLPLFSILFRPSLLMACPEFLEGLFFAPTSLDIAGRKLPAVVSGRGAVFRTLIHEYSKKRSTQSKSKSKAKRNTKKYILLFRPS